MLEYLGERAAQPLVDRIVSAATPSPARSWMVARLETIAQDVPLDWAAIYSSQLEDRSCTSRRMAVERLRRLGEQLANSPGDASLYIQRGEVHRDNRHWQLSWQDYESALSKAEDANLRLEVLFCMGRMKLQSGQHDEALVLLRQVAGKNPE